MPGHGITTVRDGPTQGGSALRKSPQLLLWDLPEPGWLLVLTTLAWPRLRHGQAPYCTGSSQGWLARLVAGARKQLTFSGMQPFPGSMTVETPTGTQPLCRMGKQPLLFKTVYSSPENSWWRIFAMCLSQAATNTKAAEQSPPDLDLACKAPCPSPLKPSLCRKAFSRLHWWDSHLAPCSAGVSALPQTRWGEAQWDN